MSETVFYNNRTLVGIGSVGIGTTNPGYKLEVSGGAIGVTGTNNYLYYAVTNSTASGAYMLFDAATAGGSGRKYQIGSSGSGNNPGAGCFELYDATAVASRIVVNASGNVGIGTTSPGDLLHVYGGSARVRIDAITTGDPMVYFYQDGVSKSYLGFSRSGGYGYWGFGADVIRAYSGSNVPMIPGGAGGGVRYAYCDNNGTMSFTAQLANGTLSASGGFIVSSSDFRVKSNISYVTDTALPLVEQLKPAHFVFNGDPGTKKIGFIAQDVEKVIPDAVDGKKYEFMWETNEDGTPKVDANGNLILTDKPRYRGFDATAVLAIAVKALQELSAKNTDLEQSLATATANVGSLETKLQTAQNDIDLLESRLAAIEALIGTNTSADTGSGSTQTRADALLGQV